MIIMQFYWKLNKKNERGDFYQGIIKIPKDWEDFDIEKLMKQIVILLTHQVKPYMGCPFCSNKKITIKKSDILVCEKHESNLDRLDLSIKQHNANLS